MKIGYSSFAMGDTPLAEVLCGLGEIGYEAVELAVVPGRPNSPEKLDDGGRKRLKGLFRKLKFPPPVVMVSIHPCVGEAGRSKALSHFTAGCKLAADLNFKKDPAVVICSPSEDSEDDTVWPDDLDLIKKSILELADIAKSHQTVFAMKPAMCPQLNSPERVLKFIKDVDHPALRLDFDMSVFGAEGLNLEECVEACAPKAVYAQVRDSMTIEDEMQYVLPGDGDFDYPSYMVAMKEAKYKGIVSAEITTAIHQSEEFNIWDAAEYCFDVLNEAREVAEMGWD